MKRIASFMIPALMVAGSVQLILGDIDFATLDVVLAIFLSIHIDEE